MTTLVLQVAGTVVGTALGGPAGAAIGSAIGAAAGGMIDRAILTAATPTRRIEGPRLSALAGLSATEGTPVPRLYGRARLGGQLIWATRFVEEVSTTKTGGKSTSTPRTATTTYSYYANIAVGLCEGPIAMVRRIWADGRELDLTGLTLRVHRGTEDQAVDPLIGAKEGDAPAYRGLAYIVLERLPLGPFGNRVPQLAVEVVRPVSGLGGRIRAVNLIPGAGEFVYAPRLVTRIEGYGKSTPENRHVLTHETDWAASLDALQALCPALESVALVVTWFGDDLRAGRCTIAPRVEGQGRVHDGVAWTVAGLSRDKARVVSQVEGRPAYGGTPSDATVLAAIADLKARGLKVTLYPFVMMDVPAGNALPDPWTGQGGQPPYPWRGRITCDPAPGRPGTVDATAAAADQVATFFGRADRNAFSWQDGTVAYAGAEEWSFRRLVLHYAALARAAGGVEALLIGSELAALTRVRSAPGTYPAAAHLAQLAADAAALAGPGTAIGYAADWTEYGAHVPVPGELRFPLDPLWSSPAVSFVGIDLWWPLGDWRNAPGHLDAGLARGPADPAYLARQVGGGEGFDWYYPEPGARAVQDRRPITDGLGAPWVYRVKDLVAWWSKPHVERVGNVPLASPTAWVPRSKPIRLTEVGCPAVDNGANGPNVFPDPKSSEGGLPPFSRGRRDDLMQTRAVAAVLDHFAGVAGNPVGPVPGGRMVDPARIHLWAWDARPFPAFPRQSSVWADAPAWTTGHWLTGRLEGAPVDALIARILDDAGLPSPGDLAVDGWLDGYVIDRPLSPRAALEPLAAAFGIDLVMSGGTLRARMRGDVRSPLLLGSDDLVAERDGTLLQRQRAQDSELPRQVALSFIDGDADYDRATVTSRRLEGTSRRISGLDLPAVLTRESAAGLAESILHDAWLGRETVQLRLRPGLVGVEPGDVLRLPPAQGGRLLTVQRIRDGLDRAVEARVVDPSVAAVAGGDAGTGRFAPPPPVAGPPLAVVIDWPGARGDVAVLQSLAVTADPWPGRMALWRSVDGASFDLFAVVERPAAIGELLDPLPRGPVGRWDRASAPRLRLGSGDLPQAGETEALGGAAILAVQSGTGWELLGYAEAVLVAPSTWRLGTLLRGLTSQADGVVPAASVGARVVAVDAALVPLASGAGEIGREWRWRVGPADRDVGDAAMAAFSQPPRSDPLVPLAPVRAAARRTAWGVRIDWIRCARIDADAWDPIDPPLGEATERYSVSILRAGTTLRRLEASQPGLVYAVADEIADFGAPQTRLDVAIAQGSAAVGWGRPLVTTLVVEP